MLPQGNYALAQFAECPDCFRNTKHVLNEKKRRTESRVFSLLREGHGQNTRSSVCISKSELLPGSPPLIPTL